MNMTLNNVLQYIYVTLREYPPPEVISYKIDSIDHELTGRFDRSIAGLLHIPNSEYILKFKPQLNSNPNLIINNDDIKWLFDHDIIPAHDHSTYV